MRYKVFVDTNVLMSGIFFEGNEAAVLSVKPDYFLTGDSHFFTDKIKVAVKVITAKELLDEIKKK